jgi:hypothetical protein
MQYAVIDFLWYRKNVNGSSKDAYGFDNIDQWGRPFPDPERFPSSKGGKGFKPIADKVHAMGLKFGIHLMNGINTQAVNASTPILDIDTVLILWFLLLLMTDLCFISTFFPYFFT